LKDELIAAIEESKPGDAKGKEEWIEAGKICRSGRGAPPYAGRLYVPAAPIPDIETANRTSHPENASHARWADVGFQGWRWVLAMDVRWSGWCWRATDPLRFAPGCKIRVVAPTKITGALLLAKLNANSQGSSSDAPEMAVLFLRAMDCVRDAQWMSGFGAECAWIQQVPWSPLNPTYEFGLRCYARC